MLTSYELNLEIENYLGVTNNIPFSMYIGSKE